MAYGQILGQTPFPVAQNVEYSGKISGVDNVKSALDKLNDEVVKAAESGGGVRTAKVVIGAKNGGWTEKDCDYLCDGSNDETVFYDAIKKLGQSPNSGKTLFILGGKYHPGNWTIPLSVRVVGEDPINCKIEGRINFSGSDGILEGVTVLGNYTQRFAGENITIKNCNFYCRNNIENQPTIFVEDTARYLKVLNCNFFGSAIFIGCLFAIITNNVFYNYGLYSSMLHVANGSTTVTGNLFMPTGFIEYTGKINHVELHTLCTFCSNILNSANLDYLQGLEVLGNENTIIGNTFNYSQQSGGALYALVLNSVSEKNLVMGNVLSGCYIINNAPRDNNHVLNNIDKIGFS